MNAEKLRTYVSWLLTDEKEFKVQEALTELNGALSSLSGAPQEAVYQQAVANSLEKLTKQLRALQATYDAAQFKGVASIGARPFFSEDMLTGIRESIVNNAMTPTVAHKYVSDLLQERDKYIKTIEGTRNNLRALAIDSDDYGDAEAEVGFEIPRSLFDNNLDGLINELRAIRRIVRAFSELATGSAEEISVHSISTTDPTFYFGLGALTAAQIGYAVQWSLERWKQVEEIRKVRAETRKINAFSETEISQMFDRKIEETVRAEIDRKTTDLVGDATVGRKAEQRTDVAWALESLLARVERGMTVEIRISPPATGKAEDGTEMPEDPVYEEIRQINRQLVFPPAEPAPVLQLPGIPTDERTRKVRGAAARGQGGPKDE